MSENKWDKRFFFDINIDSTPVPNLLIKYYSHLGLSEAELVFILQLLMLGKKGCPPVKEISGNLPLDETTVKQNLASLIEKGFIVPETGPDRGKAGASRYFLDGLYDKLMDIWACEMAGKNEIAAAAEPERGEGEGEFATVYRAFEKEFGRPLSPMENEKIVEWLDKLAYQPEIVLESLKRAVLRGVYNFNYIDKILLEWQKSHVRTVNEAVQHERTKMAKEKPGSRKIAVTRNQTKSFKDLYEN